MKEILSQFEGILKEKIEIKRLSSSEMENGFSVDVETQNAIPLSLVEGVIEKIDTDKLLYIQNISGVFSEEEKMIRRIEILIFENEKDLEKHLEKEKESSMRDHRRLGQEMGLWTFSPLVGSGLPMFTPEGTQIRNALLTELQAISKKFGARPITIPHIAKKELYDTSGHSEKFGDELLQVKSHYGDFILKPVNCPHHTQIYDSEIRSYRDLPISYVETTMQYRDEKPGEIGGLTRVRAITVDDGHTFCTGEQIEEEARKLVQVIKSFYKPLGLTEYKVSLSVRDSKNKDKYIGDEEDWENAEKMLQSISDSEGLNAKVCEGEAAIYGPKLDFVFVDSLGRDWQLSTIQIDFAMPKRFNLKYIKQDGTTGTPVMIHRAVLGSYERFIAVILEHFGGWLPAWLAPTCVGIIPVGEKYNDVLDFEDVITKKFISNEPLGKKIQKAIKQRIPFIIVVGEKEKDVFKLQHTKTKDIACEGTKEEISAFLEKWISEKKCV